MPGDESSFCRSALSQSGQLAVRAAVTNASKWRPQVLQAYSKRGIADVYSTRMPRLLPVLALTALVHSSVAAQAPGPRLVVLNKEDATLVTVDPASGKVLARVPTGEAPHEVAVSEDGKTAFVGNYGAQTPGSTISIVDLTAMKETRRLDVSPLRLVSFIAVR